MKKFENHAQFVKYKVIKEVVRAELNNQLMEELLNIPKRIIPGRITSDSQFYNLTRRKRPQLLVEEYQCALFGHL